VLEQSQNQVLLGAIDAFHHILRGYSLMLLAVQEPENQTINQSIKQASKQSINQSIERSFDQAVNS
jgi:hypothetical protein